MPSSPSTRDCTALTGRGLIGGRAGPRNRGKLRRGNVDPNRTVARPPRCKLERNTTDRSWLTNTRIAAFNAAHATARRAAATANDDPNDGTAVAIAITNSNSSRITCARNAALAPTTSVVNFAAPTAKSA